MRAPGFALREYVDVPWVPLGVWPTPLTERVIDGRPLWIKHEGDAHPTYGGNKVRTLEAWLGHARAIGARRIWAIGAYGSNHTIATLVHAPTAGLSAGAIVFPQPASAWAVENCGAIIAASAAATAAGAECPIIRLRSVIEVPFAAWWIARRERDAVVMPPGGATPIGTFGAMSAAFELAAQIAGGAAPPPARIVVPVGSTCTTAGLVAGIALAQAVGAWPWPAPIVHGVRVTPWPVTSRVRTADLARRTLARIERLGGPRVAIGFAELIRRLVIDARALGRGYGRTTPRADDAIRAFADADRANVDARPRLDTVYAGKAAAALLRLHRAGDGPLIFWASKATTSLAPPSPAALDRAPPALAAWWSRHAHWLDRPPNAASD